MTYSKELESINHKDFVLGQYIYMGMGKCNGMMTVCISVAYKIDYCVKKAQEFEDASPDAVVFYKINKIKIGELEACDELLVIDL